MMGPEMALPSHVDVSEVAVDNSDSIDINLIWSFSEKVTFLGLYLPSTSS